jgi:hypothetical protein
MQPGTIYEEKILSKWLTTMFVSITIVMLFLSVYQILVKPLGSKPAPTWFYLIMALLFMGITYLFGRLTIKMTPASISVGYGLLRQSFNWDNVEGCFLDETSAFQYGGAGLRMARIGGKWRIIYNVVESPRVVLSLKEGRFKEVVFSTRHPEEVMKTIKEWAHIQEKQEE